jgi:hypothetical protein
MPSYLEFHDSTVLGIERDGDTVGINLDAYVHRWEQVDGQWRGTGWSQLVRIRFHEASLTAPPDLPAELAGGELRTADTTYDDLVPLPFSSAVSASLRLDFMWGGVVNVSGSDVALDPLAEGHYIEDLPNEFKPRGC